MIHFRLSGLGVCLAACLTLAACIESEDDGGPISTGAAGTSAPPTTGAAGTTAAAGTSGSAGTSAAAGTSGAAGTGAAGTSAAGGTTGAAGTGAAGTKAAGGTTGSAGTSGSDGGVSADAGSDAPPTFTMVYEQILGPTPQVAASSCAGAMCHRDPGGGKGIEHINMNTKAMAYVGVKKFLVAGNPTGSKLYTEVNTGAMPMGKPKLPANLIKMISDWIKAGALDN